jgi:hypothetical protein
MLFLFLFENFINFSCTWVINEEFYKRLVFSSSDLSPRLYDVSGFVSYVADTQTLVLWYPERKSTNSAQVGFFADFEILFIDTDN